MKLKWIQIWKNIGVKVFGIISFGFLYIPVIIMIIFSLDENRNNQIWSRFSTKWYAKLLKDEALWEIFGRTVFIAVITTVVVVIVGTLGAVALSKLDFRGKTIIDNALYLPLIVPQIVIAIMIMLGFNAFQIPLGLGAMIVGNITVTLPYVYITVKSRMVGMDPSLEEASADLGAEKIYTLLHVILPGIFPGIVSGGFLAFTIGLDNLIIMNFLSTVKTPTLPVKVYSLLKTGIPPEINALSTIVLFILSVGVSVYLMITHKKNCKKVIVEE